MSFEMIRQRASSTFSYMTSLVSTFLRKLRKNDPITLLILPHKGPVRRVFATRYTALAGMAVLLLLMLALVASAALHVEMRAQLAAKDSRLREQQATYAELLQANRERMAALERLREQTEALQVKIDRLESLSTEVDTLLGKTQSNKRGSLPSRGSVDRRALSSRFPSRDVSNDSPLWTSGLRRNAALSPVVVPRDTVVAGPLMDMDADILQHGESGEEFETALRELETRVAFVTEKLERAKEDLSNYLTRIRHTPSGWPAYGPISSGYGYRKHPIVGEKRFHDGIDISLPFGTAVNSSADGVVLFAGWDTGYGLSVVVEHGYGYRTRYAHLSRILVRSGESVKRGQPIGRSGNSGLSTGPHLHYEVIVAGRARNPLPYLK